jgi:large subunit ribosomal protein L9
MKVILTERVATLGNIGEVVNVSAGHARNYLIPKKFAVVADDSNKKTQAHLQKMLAKKMDAAKKVATDLKDQLDKVELDLIKKVGANGVLFGTVTTNELSKHLAAKGFEVARRVISLAAPIKTVGNFEARAKLLSGVEATFKIKVSIDPKQAEEMKKKAEEAAARKAQKEIEKAEALAAGKDAETAEEVAKTEDQLLSEEANKILRD